MSDIIEFLNTRIAEDKNQALDHHHEPLRYGVDKVTDLTLSERFLSEAEAKSAIIDQHTEGPEGFCGDKLGAFGCDERWPCPSLRAIATIYSNHSDFRPEWRYIRPIDNQQFQALLSTH